VQLAHRVARLEIGQTEPGEDGESVADPADGRGFPWWPLVALLGRRMQLNWRLSRTVLPLS
jgi:hypothetical protein